MASALTHLETTTIVAIELIRGAAPPRVLAEVIASPLDVPPVVPLPQPGLVPAPLLGLVLTTTATATLKKVIQAQTQAIGVAAAALVAAVALVAAAALVVASVVLEDSDRALSRNKTTRWEI